MLPPAGHGPPSEYDRGRLWQPRRVLLERHGRVRVRCERARRRGQSGRVRTVFFFQCDGPPGPSTHLLRTGLGLSLRPVSCVHVRRGTSLPFRLAEGETQRPRIFIEITRALAPLTDSYYALDVQYVLVAT